MIEKEKKKGGRPEKYSVNIVLKAIKNTGGIKTQICSNLNCDRKTLAKYIDKYPEIKEAIETEEESVLDMAESSLFALIQNGDSASIFYFLNNKGRKRGYGFNPHVKIEDDSNKESESCVKTGVLETPGMLTEEAWEKAAK